MPDMRSQVRGTQNPHNSRKIKLRTVCISIKNGKNNEDAQQEGVDLKGL